jgi:hypothetical protein
MKKQRAERRNKLVELAEHLRHCVECHETDVLQCDVGRGLWIDAAMTTEVLDRFADGRLGCAECGGYWNRNDRAVRHVRTCTRLRDPSARDGDVGNG